MPSGERASGQRPAERAAAIRELLWSRVASDAQARVTAVELDDAEAAIAAVLADAVDDARVRAALTASVAHGAAPRNELPLCRDVVLSLDTVLGLG